MAKIQKKDHSLAHRLEDLERRIRLLKMQYEKYFSGLEAIEPLKGRQAIQRVFRDFQKEPIADNGQRHKLTTIRAQFSSYQMYWQRNLVMIERGTHPKMKFRAAVRDRQKREASLMRQMRVERQAKSAKAMQDREYRGVFDDFVKARESVGMSGSLSFESLKSKLEKQKEQIRSRFNCEEVEFKVAVENGKVKMKAIPIRNEKTKK